MLRSIVASSSSAIYAACWSSDNQAIAYSQEKQIVIKPLSPNTNSTQVIICSFLIIQYFQFYN